MLTITADFFMQWATGLMFVSLRLFGIFLSMPLFAFRAFPMRLRLMVVLAIAVAILPGLVPQARGFGLTPPTFVAAGIELLIGVFIGFMIRLGLMAIELAAEILSNLTGLSFATNYVRDPNLASGLVGEFLGLMTLALMFALNVHLAVLEVVIESFKTLPFGQWPVYLIFNVIQAVLARTSPQFNLFSVGFAIAVPLAFFVLMITLPDLPQFVARSVEAPFALIRQGLGR